MKETKEINKKVAAGNGSIDAGDLQTQLQKLADANDLQQKVSIFLESTPKSVNDSVELKKTSKGTNWTIKVYGDSAEAMQRANTLFEQCKNLYGVEEDE